MHLLKNTRQLVQPLRPEMRLDHPPGRELTRLNRLLPCPHSGSHNLYRLRHQNPRIRAANGLHIAPRDTNTHNAAAKAEKVDRLVVRALVLGADHDGMRTVPAGEGLHSFRERGRTVEREEVLCARTQDKVFLRGVVYANNPVADAAGGVLDLQSVSMLEEGKWGEVCLLRDDPGHRQRP